MRLRNKRFHYYIVVRAPYIPMIIIVKICSEKAVWCFAYIGTYKFITIRFNGEISTENYAIAR